MSVPVIITRPAPQARQWCLQLQPLLGAGATLLPLPLIDIAPLHNDLACSGFSELWGRLHTYHAGVFVSIPAVEHFFASRPDAAARWNTLALRAWAPGWGTRQALLDAGLHAALIDCPPADAAQFDSETLWSLVKPQLLQTHNAPMQAMRVLRIRGTDLAASADDTAQAAAGTGRDWLSQAIAQAGGVADSVAVYRRQLPVWDASQLQAAQQLARQAAVWLFGSSLALENLAKLLPEQAWHACTAIATHPRIAAKAQALGFGRVAICRPALPDIAQSIQSCV